MRGLGTILNLATVAAGSLIGIYAGHRFSERLRTTMLRALGLATVAIAVVGFAPFADADEGLRRTVIAIASLIVGAVLGESLSLEDRLAGLADGVRARFAPSEAGDADARTRFIEGFIVASTVFCVGPLTVLGSVEDGLGQSIRLLTIKSTLDGVAAIGFAAVYGWGVFSTLVTIAVVQGLLTLAAVAVDPLLTGDVLSQLGATGSLLVLGIALRLLDVVRIPVVSLLPALPLAMVAAGVLENVG